METFAKVLRTIALALLSGGSAATVFAAIVMVKAAKANGIPVEEAAAANAPIFIGYSRIVLGAAIMLTIGEALDFFVGTDKSKLAKMRYLFSGLAIATALGFSLGIVPPMEVLLPRMKEAAEAHQEFQKLHHISQMVFGASILCAFVSLVLPVFSRNGASGKPVESASTTDVSATQS